MVGIKKHPRVISVNLVTGRHVQEAPLHHDARMFGSLPTPRDRDSNGGTRDGDRRAGRKLRLSLSPRPGSASVDLGLSPAFLVEKNHYDK